MAFIGYKSRIITNQNVTCLTATYNFFSSPAGSHQSSWHLEKKNEQDRAYWAPLLIELVQPSLWSNHTILPGLFGHELLFLQHYMSDSCPAQWYPSTSWGWWHPGWTVPTLYLISVKVSFTWLWMTCQRPPRSSPNCCDRQLIAGAWNDFSIYISDWKLPC